MWPFASAFLFSSLSTTLITSKCMWWFEIFISIWILIGLEVLRIWYDYNITNIPILLALGDAIWRVTCSPKCQHVCHRSFKDSKKKTQVIKSSFNLSVSTSFWAKELYNFCCSLLILASAFYTTAYSLYECNSWSQKYYYLSMLKIHL